MPDLRVLRPGDEVDLDTFLARHADTSMFLRANARAAGLVDRGEPMQATYVAAVVDGRIRGVAAHCWNGMVLVQAPEHVAAVTREAVRHSRRAVTGFSGPWEQVVPARRALDLEAAPAAKDSREELYVLDLARLILPPALAGGQLRCCHPQESELEQLVEWRVQFALEALGAADGPELRRSSRADVLLHHQRGSDWVLRAGPDLVSYSVFNAMLPEIVQIGGVWTPPELRRRGYARSVVAGSLLAARKQSVQRAVLFADPSNASARAAYLALGFQIVGDYGLVLLRPPPTG
ncbi:MAG TPA: GNAT family N-acetyltransferase [Gemmatimonadales bacterium]|nr:GNAT family N-acetyltransferase [Gemmatimonadales bacterium]